MGKKYCGKKEKLLVTSNFSFYHSVFNRPVSQTRQKVSLCGNGLTLSQTTNFRLFQTGRFHRSNLKFDENGRKFSKLVENNVGRGEIAPYEESSQKG